MVKLCCNIQFRHANGNTFVVGKSEGGYIIPFGTNKRVHVDYSICGGFNNGDVVSFVENKAGDIVINGFEKGTGLTNAGVPIEVNKAITGVVLKTKLGTTSFIRTINNAFQTQLLLLEIQQETTIWKVVWLQVNLETFLVANILLK